MNQKMKFVIQIWFSVGVYLDILNLVYCTQPTGCSYDGTESVGLYTCDYTAVSFPLAYSGFSPSSQRLKLTKINGVLASGSSTFSGFASYDTTTLDSNYPASLELQCSTSSSTSLTLSAGTFTGMSYVQRLAITNCYTDTLVSNLFADFGQLDTLTITGGRIGTIDAGAFSSLDIQPLTLVPDPAGLLEISNLVMPATTLTASVFAPLVNVSHIKLDTLGLTAIQNSDFSSNTAMRTLTVSNNAFTTLASGFFTGLDGLAIVNVSGITWDCSCTNLWFLSYADDNGIEMEGGLICSTPATYANKKAKVYYSEMCTTVDYCNGNAGIVVGTSCMPAWDLAGYCILLVALILSCIALGLICHTRRKLITAKNQLAKKKSTSWNKVQEAMKRRGGAGQKPPAATTKPNKGKGWV